MMKKKVVIHTNFKILKRIYFIMGIVYFDRDFKVFFIEIDKKGYIQRASLKGGWILTYFYTKENKVKFRIEVDCKIALINENLNEITTAGRRRPHDFAILNKQNGGLNLRYSLTEPQKLSIINEIAKITKNDIEYCIDNDVIGLTKNHIINDYCQGNPQILVDRGWPVEEDDLLEEVISFLCNIKKVEKAVIKFDKNGESNKKLRYTVVGVFDGYEGTMAINFQPEISRKGEKETILVVTILERKEKSQV
ncbi:hypothetical protein SOP94_26520 [Peribacillus frigoritolerans]|uniref:hypothetical protein n=1 Tax=Peribacillus frigoritolerans TaxID=450367 RepID=UPI002B2418A9|nr:hypothetical protein [Peribacillus frigoritolerans]MEB2631968.1 hypothetical protein [Peribacillus frigoritolerans]